ncbi:MAG: pilus assembly protein PilM [Huintestinicola sp.]
MLSFDITDRHVRIIRGTEARNRIRVSSASTIDLDEGLIVNGHIKDIPKMATMINDELKARNMADKEAVVTISSNLVIFKELRIPKAKTNSQMLTMVTNQMQHTMGIAEDYSISYSVAGEVEEEGVQALKILATACPFEVVDSFRKVFQMLSISLKSVVVSCNAISRLILSDKKVTSKMPMLVVQVDPNFVSLNLYEDNQLSFARFASIDAVDYDNSEDYVFEAVHENIHRMLQFHKQRNPENPIQNVVFYGDTSEYIRLTNTLENMDVSTSLLGVPNNIAGYENIEFQSYANAIGAMFRSNKENERINLLETDASAGKTNAGASFLAAVGAAFGISAVVVAAVWFGMNVMINGNQAEVAKIDEWINSEETQTLLTKVDDTQAKIDKVNAFKATLQLAKDNFDTKVDFNEELLMEIATIVSENGAELDEFTFGSGEITIKCITEDVLAADKVARAVDEVMLKDDQKKFENLIYTGFKRNDNQQDEASDVTEYEFEMTFMVHPNEIEAPEEETAETAEGGEE